nr:putative reverse transcriptase domain-containing protein [Tanacetum cinerariifolium]
MIITLKWIYKIKLDDLGGVLKNIARLVMRSYSQEEGIDLVESFTSVARLKFIHIFIAFAAHMNKVVYQMDMKTAFWNGNHVYKLNKTLYGLKQAPCTWNDLLSLFLLSQSSSNRLLIQHCSSNIVMENPNHLNEPNKVIPEVNPVVPEPNQVADIRDPNEMVYIPGDIDLVDYDEEDPEEEPEEKPKEDVDIELEDDVELIFPYKVESDKTLPPRDVSSDWCHPILSQRIKRENATLKKISAETETKLVWAHIECEIAERRLHESRVRNKRIMLPKSMYEARMCEIIRDQVTTSMAEFVANMNHRTGCAGAGGAGADGADVDGTGADGAGAGGDGANGARADGAGVGGVGLAALKIIGDCKKRDKVKFATATLQGRALTWWNGRIASMGIDAANGTSWTENIRGDVTSLRPVSIDEVVHMAYQLMGQIIQHKIDEVFEGERRKGKGDHGGRAILCGEKKVRIRLKGKTLVIEGYRNNSRLKIVSRIKAQKYIENGCGLFLAQVTKEELKLKRLEDVPVIQDFPKYCTCGAYAITFSVIQNERVVRTTERVVKKGKVNVFADTLNMKDKELIQVRALAMTVHNNLPEQIQNAQVKGCKEENIGMNLDMSTAYHPKTDGRSERTIQTLEDMLRACVMDFGSGWDKHLPLAEFSYNNSTSIKAAPFEALYRSKCRSPVCWSEVGDAELT